MDVLEPSAKCPIDLDEYFVQHKVVEQARAYIRSTIELGPSRTVGRHTKGNVCSEFQSRKMGFKLATESRTGEFGYAIQLDYATHVRAFYDQPTAIEVTRTRKNGQKVCSLYHPDFLVLEKDGPFVDQYKPRQKLDELLAENPADWIASEGGIQYRPADAAFSNMGLTHRVISSNNLNPVEISNLKLLMQSRDSDCTDLEKIHQNAKAVLNESIAMRLSELQSALKITDLTPVLQLIGQEALFVDLTKNLLTFPESCWVSTSRKRSALFQDLNPGVMCHASTLSPMVTVSASQVPNGITAERIEQICERLDAGEKSRSARRWKAKIKAGIARGLTKAQALCPAWSKSGNQTPKRIALVLDFLEESIENRLQEFTRISSYAAHKAYTRAAREHHAGHSPVSRPTFIKYLLSIDAKTRAEAKGGKRAANAAEPPSPVETRELKAQRPFELATCDHYLVDLHCPVLNASETFVDRPWLTVLRDIATGFILAVRLGFQPPSRLAVSVMIRECVRRHNRLPEAIVVDNGAEFRSVYFSTLLAHCGVHKHGRPSGHPRYGSEAERFFGLFKTQWLTYRPGLVAAIQQDRGVSPSHQSQHFARIPLELLYQELIDFCDWHNAHSIGTGLSAPALLLRQGLEQFSCSGKKMMYDDSFTVVTAVDCRQFTIDPVRGIHIGVFHYWHDDLLMATGRKQDVEVRIDPEDPYKVYALVNEKWVTCRSARSIEFDLKSPVIRIAEGVKVLEGREARKRAAEVADQALHQNLKSADDRLNNVTNDQLADSVPQPPPPEEAPVDNLFKRVRDLDQPGYEPTKWKDKK